MSKILITGATGFIGSHLAELCVENALEKAEMLQFIKTKKDFLNFSLADDGLKISGG